MTDTPEFTNVLELLHRHGVRFLVVGGVACAFNGFVRATEDVDILVAADPANLDRLLTALGEWGDGHARELRREDFTLAPGAIQVVEEFPLDIFTLLDGRDYAEFAPRALATPAGIRYLGPADLIAVKRSTHREKDAIDVLALQRQLRSPQSTPAPASLWQAIRRQIFRRKE
ncbi:MAG: hypothetical protein WC789_02240 [Lentisphaeria bacterium]|jgi:hypothetical protein